jgi:hypothetical protein
MADVHTVLRCDLATRATLLTGAATAWRPAAGSPSERSSACPRSRREVRESVNLHGLAENRTSRAENAPRCKALIFLTSSALRPGRTSRPFYLAIARSAVGPPPFLRSLSPNCDQTRTQVQHVGSRFRAGSLQLLCRHFDGRTCVTHRRIDRRSDTGAAAVVPVVCRSYAGRRPADGSRSNVVMSGVVDSGRERAHGNIDAIDAKQTCASQ